MDNQPKKVKFGLTISAETLKKVEQLYKGDNAECRSEFIERAVEFYCGYLTAESYREYFPQVIVSTIRSSLNSLENRTASLLYKNALELSVLLHVIAATNDIDDLNLSRLRGHCKQEVDSINGAIKFDDAVRYQKG